MSPPRQRSRQKRSAKRAAPEVVYVYVTPPTEREKTMARTSIDLRAPYGTVIMAFADGVYRLQCDTADLLKVKEWFAQLAVETGNQHVKVLEAQLVNAAQQHKELVAAQTYKPKHVQIREQIEALQAELAKEQAALSHPSALPAAEPSAPVVRVMPDTGDDMPMMPPGVPIAQTQAHSP